MKQAKSQETKGGPVAVSRAPMPRRPLRRVQNEIDRFFEDPFGGLWGPGLTEFGEWIPAVDISEDNENVLVHADIPGMKKEDLEVYLTGSDLNIVGERKFETEENTRGGYRAERHFGRFHRVITLPTPVDPEKMEAHYKEGVLTVRCPKTEESKRKQIEIKTE